MPKPKAHRWKDGTTTWRVRFRLNGKNTSETFHTEHAANVFCHDLEVLGPVEAVRRRDEYDKAHTTPTLDKVAERFFAWKAARVRSDRTVADYRRDYRKHIAPVLGGKPIGAITDSDVQHLVDGLLRRRLSPKTVCDRHALLHAILKFATSSAGDKLIEANPAIGTDLPKRRPSAPKALLPQEWQALYAALRQLDPDAADLALFLLHSGWRWSEATALTGWAVDDDGVTVRVTMGRVVRRNADNEFILVDDDGKAHASMRSIRLDRNVSEMVRRRAYEARDGLLFTTRTGSMWRYSNFVNRAWRPAVALANLARRPTPHWLRHTHVVWMVQTRQASLPELQRRIGHADIGTTINVYGRALEDVSPAALDAFAAIAAGRPPAIG